MAASLLPDHGTHPKCLNDSCKGRGLCMRVGRRARSLRRAGAMVVMSLPLSLSGNISQIIAGISSNLRQLNVRTSKLELQDINMERFFEMKLYSFLVL